ncbi:MAG: class I SAM-dependent methyltransferase [Dehalococcoidia bacterium]|nr:class I SAM-dependent methyltransferase [Dehalococcoidia bacterium]
MGHKFRPERVHLLTSPERRALLDPQRVLAMLPIAPGQHVADVGCGPGYFTIPLAQAVRGGTVYALDVQPEMVALVRETVRQSGVGNVEARQTAEIEIPNEDASLDGVFLAFVLHEVEGAPSQYLAMLRRKLRPGGWLAVADWKKAPMEEGPPLHERLTEQQVRQDGEAAALRWERAGDVNAKQYLVLFCRPETERA